MKTRNIQSIILISILLWISTGCREKIELELDSTYTRLVVEGTITDEIKAHRIVLTYSSDYFFSETPPPATGAVVEISDGSQVFFLTEVAPGIYETGATVQGIHGREYTLTIRGLDVNGNGTPETYTAKDLLKPVMILDSIVVEKQSPLTNPPLFKVKGWGQEPATPDDCYQWRYALNGTLQTDTLDKTIFVDDTFVNGSYLPGLTMFMDIKAVTGDTITVETRSLSRPYYDFLVTLMLETSWNQGGGAGPPANVKGNLSNGALGYFNASAVSVSTAIVP